MSKQAVFTHRNDVWLFLANFVATGPEDIIYIATLLLLSTVQA